MKFLLSLSSDTSGVKVEFQEVRKRAYLMLSAWADEMRLRRMAQALRPWWKLVIYHRSIEYRLGISARIIWNAIRKVIYKTLYKKWVKWVRNIIELREVERDAAARLLQRVYRGYNARCTFAEHARRWIACIPIQTLWRKYACIVKYQCARRLIINSQARIRLYLCQRYMYLLHISATKIQSLIRMYKYRKKYIAMETAVCNMQTTFRAWQARKLFYRLVEKRVRLYEIQLVSALCL